LPILSEVLIKNVSSQNRLYLSIRKYPEKQGKNEHFSEGIEKEQKGTEENKKVRGEGQSSRYQGKHSESNELQILY
jgi:hypothetical protein